MYLKKQKKYFVKETEKKEFFNFYKLIKYNFIKLIILLIIIKWSTLT